MSAENGLRVRRQRHTHHGHAVPVEKKAEEDEGNDGEEVVRRRLLGVSGGMDSHVSVLVGPHHGEGDEEGEHLHDGPGREAERRGPRGDGVAVEDETRVAGVVEESAEDVGEHEQPVLREREGRSHTQVWTKVRTSPAQRTSRKVRTSTKSMRTGFRRE